jgi:hypothetical protein
MLMLMLLLHDWRLHKCFRWENAYLSTATATSTATAASIYTQATIASDPRHPPGRNLTTAK